jgi:hypothetical protein
MMELFIIIHITSATQHTLRQDKVSGVCSIDGEPNASGQSPTEFTLAYLFASIEVDPASLN